ncbi:MAG: DUF2333 family protein, partial [Candidatus Desulfatibia sp.]|uniref:DUF2333 family protein n=1 Tax=Candidatus Desulfatibia sp. TaxID=3101189 RepID=UPI002F2E99E5
METSKNNDNNIEATEFKIFATKRVVAGILLTVVALWVVGTVLGFFEQPAGVQIARQHDIDKVKEKAADKPDAQPPHKQPETTKQAPVKAKIDYKEGTAGYITSTDLIARDTVAGGAVKKEPIEAVHEKPQATEPAQEEPEAQKPAPLAVSDGIEITAVQKARPKGVAFIEAISKPLAYELHDRFWGWRPNDILNFTDNINNFQLGVLEVTRRTVVILTERISRTGSTAAFDKNLERAMNWFMIKSDRYWFPSPESKYSAGLKELEIYKEKLEKGEANFYTRTDNLIPLLMAYADLLGSCDENLVKYEEDDGTPVSFFKSDDYFFYALGVASAMYTILEAIQEDFHAVIESRRGLEVLHRAIESSRRAIEIKPWVITNA